MIILVGLEDQEEELWDNADRIARAHKNAGQKIRGELFKAMSSVNILELEKVGLIVINLNNENVGSLIIIRVVEPTENRQIMASSTLPFYYSIKD
jgi:hypothetical protein